MKFKELKKIKNKNKMKNNSFYSSFQVSTHNKPAGSIYFDQELKLMLLRHWTLWDSLNYSNYIVSKLGLWREPGRILLKRLLAKAGIPLDEAK